jgi:hypothetical protein
MLELLYWHLDLYGLAHAYCAGMKGSWYVATVKIVQKLGHHDRLLPLKAVGA